MIARVTGANQGERFFTASLLMEAGNKFLTCQALDLHKSCQSVISLKVPAFSLVEILQELQTVCSSGKTHLKSVAVLLKSSSTLLVF